MSDKLYALLSKAIACTGFCVLAIMGYPWWGLVCLIFAACVEK